MYRTQTVAVSPGDSLYSYLDRYAHLAGNLYNAAMFRIRQIFIACGKDTTTPDGRTVMHEVHMLEEAYPSIHVRRVIGYNHLEKLMRVTRNPDFFSGLPAQTAQNVLRQAAVDFDGWRKALRDFYGNPGKYHGRPGMPGYKNGGVCTFTITNQEAVLYAGQHGAVELKLPHRKERQVLKGPCWGGRLKEVCVKPCHGRYLLRIVLETEDVHMPSPGKESAGIDFGVDNIAAIACTDGSAVLYRGGAILSGNRKYIKLRAEYAGILAKGRARPCASSRRLTDMAYHHANFNADQVHKISADIVRWCVAHHAGTLVLGTNRGWKTACRMGSRNNRDFVSMPSGRLQAAVARKAERAGITVIEQEESYTSKADLTAGDYMPVYGADDNRAVFSGKRIHRGLYRTRDGLLVNADCMAAGNILRKAVPDAWEGRTDFRFLCGPETRGFRDLNPSAGTGNMAQGT